MKREGVLVVGSANMDLVVMTDRFPQPGETILGNHFQMFPGGKGANQAVCCARLNGLTYFLGRLGQDLFGDRLFQNMQSDGVKLDTVKRDEAHPTGVALIVVDSSGQNQIVVAPGSNMQLSSQDLEDHRQLFRQVRAVIVQLEIPEETVFQAAKLATEQDAVFILNPAPARALPDDLLSRVDYLTPNETELASLSGKKVEDIETAEEAARQLIAKGVTNVVVTLGEQGAMLVTSDKAQLFPTRSVEVVDTTAAGDAFNGALALAISEEQDIGKAILFANMVASTSVTALGAQSSMPYRNTIQALLKEQSED